MIRELATIARHAVIYGSGFLLARAAGFLLVPLYTRFLTPDAYGVIELLDLTGFLVGTFIMLGMEQAVMRYYHAYEDPADRARVLTTAIAFSAVSGLVIVACLLPTSGALSRLVLGSDRYEHLFFVSFVTLLVASVLNLQKVALRAQQRSVLFTSISLLQTGVAIALNILFVAVLQYGPVGIFYSTLIGSSALSIYLAWRMIREVGFGIDLTKLRSMLGYGVYFVPAGLASFVLNWANRYFLNAYETLEVVGHYALAYKISMIVTLLVAVPFNQIWHSYLFEIQRQENARDVYARVATYFIGALIAVSLGIALLSEQIVTVMAAPAYRPAYTVIPVTVAAMVFFCADNVFQVGLMVSGQSRRLSAARWVAAAGSLLLNWALIPTLGMMGAALATLCSFIVSCGLILWRAQQVYYIPFEYRRLGVLGAAALIAYALGWLLPSTPLALAIVLKSAAWLVFPGLLLAAGFVSADERAGLRQLVGEAKRRFLGPAAAASSGGAAEQ